ncbi:MAG: hypothetical protein HQL52_03745 [Magnetococcales bacterium]|nr:hypothetical protein [Magnetococcales bacterium]
MRFWIKFGGEVWHFPLKVNFATRGPGAGQATFGQMERGFFYPETPLEAETAYFHAVRSVRRGDPGSIKLTSDIPGLPGAYFRTDSDWSGPREQNPERHKMIWATPEEGWTGPTRWQLKGSVKVAGLTKQGAAELVGKNLSQWKKWESDPATAKNHHGIPWASWFAFLIRTGMYPPPYPAIETP